MNHNECRQFIDPVSNRLRKLTEANRSLAEIESLDDLLLRLMDLAKEVTAAEASLLFVYNSESRLLEIVSIKDDRFADRADELFKGKGFLKIGEGLAGWVAQNRKAVMVEDAQNDPRFSKRADKQRNLTTKTILCVPLVYQEELLGVLSALNARAKPFFDEEDLAILESFADLAADCTLAEEFLRDLVDGALNECAADLAFFEEFVSPGLLARLEALQRADFARMTYTEAVVRLQQSGASFNFPVTWGGDLQSEHERYLTEQVVGGPAKHGRRPRR